MMVAPARQTGAEGATLAARANFRTARSASGEAIASIWAGNLIGSGPAARSRHPNREMRRTLESIWRRFYARCDVEGLDLCGFLLRMVRWLVTAGEALLIMSTSQRGEVNLRLLNPEQLDRSQCMDVAGGNRIDFGVERNAEGEVVAYWIFTDQNPDLFSSTLRPSVRVPASDVIFIFDPKWPGQVRGVSWFLPVPSLLDMLDRLLEALGERMNAAALFAGFLTDLEGRGGGFTDNVTIDPATLRVEPGTIRILPSGTDMRFNQVPDVEGASDLIRHLLRQIAVGVGLPFEILSGDMSQVNYSSTKAGFSQFYRRCRALRASLLVPLILDKLWARVITIEVLSGRLVANDFAMAAEDYFAVSWGWSR
jgi:lambda family phage portal protein